jgi:hypothetical protein
MKSTQEIIQTTPDLEGIAKENIFGYFLGGEYSPGNKPEDFEGFEPLFSRYGGRDYEGDYWGLFHKDDKLYEVNGSHCSCYGLEGQFDPEEVLLIELVNRLQKGTLGTYEYNNFKEDLCKFIGLEL